MSAIAGIFDLSGAEIQLSDLRRMVDILAPYAKLKARSPEV